MISNSFQNYTWLLNIPAYCFDFNVYKQAYVNMSLDLGSTIECFKERYRFSTITITYIHSRIQEIFVGFGGGGGGRGGGAGPSPTDLKKSSDVVFFPSLFVSPQLILQRQSSDHGFFKENYY